MLEKKHLVFLAGATAPFVPPLCTALPVAIPKRRKTDGCEQIHIWFGLTSVWLNEKVTRDFWPIRRRFNVHTTQNTDFLHCTQLQSSKLTFTAPDNP